MRKARAGRRFNLSGIAAAAAVIALVAGAAVVSNGGSGDRTRNLASGELPPLKEDPKLSPVPFERTEDYVILRVDAAHAAEVGSELATVAGSQPAVVGRTSSATTYVVPKSVAQSLTVTDGVSAVPDTRVKMTAQQTNPPSWGLDRLDGATRDNSYSYISEGSGRYVYVIDTGVYGGNSDFGGRVRSGYDAVNDGNGTDDCNGHGTHVAGTIGGSQYGVAKSATIVAVRVLDCAGSGYSSSVVAGINWVIASHPGGTGVINMSLGGPTNAAIDQAVADATAAGLVVVVAAGNSSADACSYSPARAPSALTIGAIDESNAKASYSNSGSCVDMWAPGTGITSTWIGGSSATRVLSGTSMASPHVAGLAARMLQARPGITVSEMENILTTASRTADPAALPVVEFAEAPDFATPTTTIDPATTTTVDPATTTTEPVTTTIPDVNTTVPVVTTTTVVPAPTTTVVRTPRTTVPGRGDDDSRKPKKPLRPAPRPREFELRYGDDSARNTLFAAWVDDNTG